MEPVVLVVGDSLEVGCAAHLQSELGATPVSVDAADGRTAWEGVEVLRDQLRPEHRVVVFDLGTNDDPAQPDVLEGALESARELAGQRGLVVATINGPPVAGVPLDGLNLAVVNFAARHGAIVVPWREAATADPGLLGDDALHASARGYEVRAGLVARGVEAVLATDR